MFMNLTLQHEKEVPKEMPSSGRPTRSMCVSQRSKCSLGTHISAVDFRHIRKTYGLNMDCFKNCSLNFHHQPPTNCFADTCVLQHVPVADCGSWLHILRTKQTPFIEISSARKPASSSPRVMEPHFLAHKFCTHCQSAQLCKMTYTQPDGPSTSAPELLMCTRVSKNALGFCSA